MLQPEPRAATRRVPPVAQTLPRFEHEPGQVCAPLTALAPVAVLYKPFSKDDLLDAIGRARG